MTDESHFAAALLSKSLDTAMIGLDAF